MPVIIRQVKVVEYYYSLLNIVVQNGGVVTGDGAVVKIDPPHSQMPNGFDPLDQFIIVDLIV